MTVLPLSMTQPTASDRLPYRRPARAPLDRRLRVAHMGPDLSTGGGMAAVLRGLTTSPLAARHSFAVIPTYRRPQAAPRLALFALSLARLVVWGLRRGPRVVHVHSAVRGSLYRKAVIVALAKILGCRVILHVHAGEGDIAAFDARIGGFARAGFRSTFAAADRVLSVSAAGARELEARFGAGDVLVVPNPAPPVVVKADELTVEAESGVVQLLYLGGFLDPAKGARVLLDALPELLERCPTVAITLAGPGQPPVEVQERRLGAERVRWAGWLRRVDKERLLAGCHIFVLPSLSEGLPVALLEAMAHGRPIVASAVGGVPEILTDGTDALLVSAGAPAQLIEAIERLVGDPSLRRRLGDAARSRARLLNDRDVYASLEALYQHLGSR